MAIVVRQPYTVSALKAVQSELKYAIRDARSEDMPKMACCLERMWDAVSLMLRDLGEH